MNTLICCIIFSLPLKHLTITSAFGYRIHPLTKHYQLHSGTDFRAHADTVFAILSGRAKVRVDKTLGIGITLSANDFEVTYGHLSQILAIGSVNAGDPIALTGATGRVTGEHLHLSIKYKNVYADPLKFLYELTKITKSP